MPIAAKQPVHFGPFGLDAHAGELYKHGLKLKLQGHPIQILAMLLERPGELITREEIQEKLWPSENETFVDFEHGLNTAIVSCGRRWATRPRLRCTSRRCRGEGIGSWERWPRERVCRCGNQLTRRRGKHTATRVQRHRAEETSIVPTTGGNDRVTRDTQHCGVDAAWDVAACGAITNRQQNPLRSVSVNGGEETVIPTSLVEPAILHISPDGSNLIVRPRTSKKGTNEAPLWLVATNGGGARRMADIEAHDAGFAPDGRTIVIAKQHALYLTDTEGSRPAKLVDVRSRIPIGARPSASRNPPIIQKLLRS